MNVFVQGLHAHTSITILWYKSSYWYLNIETKGEIARCTCKLFKKKFCCKIENEKKKSSVCKDQYFNSLPDDKILE